MKKIVTIFVGYLSCSSVFGALPLDPSALQISQKMAAIQDKSRSADMDGSFSVLSQLAGNPSSSQEERKMILDFVKLSLEKSQKLEEYKLKKQHEFQDRELKLKEDAAAVEKEEKRKAEEKARAADVAMKRYSELMQRIATLDYKLSHNSSPYNPTGKWLKEKEECAAEATELALRYGFPTKGLL